MRTAKISHTLLGGFHGWFLLLWVACSGSTPGRKLAAALDPTDPCWVSNALPNDRMDDRPAIQEALTNNGCVRLGPGRYTLARPSGRLPVLGLISRGASLRGSGPATVLEFTGSSAGDWRGIQITGDDAVLADLSLDASQLSIADEQSHVVEVLGAERALLTGLHLRHPARPVPNGDCIRLLGEETNKVSALITNNYFLDCDRSGIGIQRGVYGLRISGNTFYKSGDQDIDMEMTGTGRGGDLIIAQNIFRNPAGNGGIAAAFAGISAHRLIFADNIVDGRGLNLYNVTQAKITGNLIIQRGLGSAIGLVKANDDILISGNTLLRESDKPGSVIAASHHNAGLPGIIRITDNTIRDTGLQEPAITIQSALEVYLTNNRISGQASTGTRISGIIRETALVVAHSNTWRGFATSLVIGNIGSVSLIGNTVLEGGGLRCGTKPVKFMASANAWTASGCP